MNTQKVRCALMLALLLVVVGAQSVFAGSDERKGSAGALELLLPIGSRGPAMASSLNAEASGVDAIYWNPAGVARATGVEAMFSTMRYIADIKLNYFAVATNFGDAGSFGFAIRSLDFGDIPITTTDAPEGTGGTYSPNFITGSLTYARAFTDRIHGGVTMKLINERVIHTSASGIALDFGVQYVSKETGLNLGVTLKNLGPQMSFDGEDLESFVTIPGQEPGSRTRALRLPGASFELPSTLEIGLGYNYKMNDENNVQLVGDFQNTNFGNDEYRMGLEYAWNNQVFIRGGYMLSQNQNDNIYGPTFGVGFNIPLEGANIMFDYAYRQVDFFDANQWFTVKFGL